jgi:3-deoxy-D-manno-octulosonic-acid transferase
MKRVGGLLRPMFAHLAWVGAQDETIASRFISLGVPSDHVEVTGSLKWDTAQVADTVAGTEPLAETLGLTGAEPLWVCGSTGPGEEELILTAYRELMERAQSAGAGAVIPRLAIVPRKPERFDDVARLVEQRGFTCIRRSNCPDGHTIKPNLNEAVILGDTMGELRKFYSLAGVVFVGRTLAPLGGSDPMEVAALGKPILIGPRFENFELPARALLEAGAAKRVRTANDLVAAVGEVLSDADGAKAMGERGRGVVLAHQGATARTADRLGGLMAHFLQTHTARKMQRNPAAAVAD